ncbi:MAG: hypothetical protein H7Z14_22220 [Anaerolineae bacterium]|nr:hypothetical protein [Phycisphaerae bacterium]
MAKQSGGMHKSGGTKSRGRTTGASAPASSRSPTRPNTPIEMRSSASRPVSSGVKKRGDRRDMNRQFTNNDQRQPNMGDPLGSGKKQTQGGGKGLKQSGRKRK